MTETLSDSTAEDINYNTNTTEKLSGEALDFRLGSLHRGKNAEISLHWRPISEPNLLLSVDCMKAYGKVFLSGLEEAARSSSISSAHIVQIDFCDADNAAQKVHEVNQDLTSRQEAKEKFGVDLALPYFVFLKNLDKLNPQNNTEHRPNSLNEEDVLHFISHGKYVNMHSVAAVTSLFDLPSFFRDSFDLQLFHGENAIADAENEYGSCAEYGLNKDKYSGVAKTVLTGEKLIPYAELLFI